MKSALKFNIITLSILFGLNTKANVFENIKSGLKTSLASYSTYFITKNMGKEIFNKSINSLKERKLDNDLILDLRQIIPVFIGNFFLIKDSVTSNLNKNLEENKNSENFEFNKSLKALFKTKNGYISLAKLTACLACLGLTIETYLKAYEDYKGDDLNTESLIVSLPAVYGVYRLAQSSKKSFDKAYKQVN